jgi:tetratricopeptide (TPR) repeat protein
VTNKNPNPVKTQYLFCAAVLLLLSYAVSQSPEIWALPFLFFERIIVAALIIVALCYFMMYYPGTRVGIKLSEHWQSRLAWIFFALLVAAAIISPMQTFFYGDGGILIPQIYKLAAGEPYQYDLLLNAKSSPLAGILIIGLSNEIPDLLHWLGIALPETALYPFHWLSIFALVALIVGIIALTEKKERLVYALFSFATAGTLFYFSYVEYYTLSFTAIALFLLASQKALEGKKPLWPAVVFYLIALAGHYETLALLPALIFLVLAKNGKDQFVTLKNIGYIFTSTLVIFVIAYFALGLHASDSRIVMPMFDVSNASGTQSYTLLSLAHIRDMLNILLLLAPVQLFVLILLLFTSKGRQTCTSLSGRFYVSALLGFLIFIFFANTSLGLARDWDIAAPLGLIISFAALAMIHGGTDSSSAKTHSAALFAGLIALILTGNWLNVNIKPQRSAERFETIMTIDSDKMYRDYAHSGYEALRKYYLNAENVGKDIELTKTKIELLDYPSDYLYLIDKSLKMQAEDNGKYLALNTWMLEQLASCAKEIKDSGAERNYSISISQIDSLTEVIAVNAFSRQAYGDLEQNIRLVANETGAPQPYEIIRAFRAYQDKDYATASEIFQLAVDMGFHSPQIFRIFGTALALQQRYSEALAVVEKGVERFPEDPMLLYTLADWYVKAGINYEAAIDMLENAYSLTDDAGLRKGIERILAKIARAATKQTP